jgi:hypothetical protein
MSIRKYIFEGHGRSREAQRAEERGGLPASRAAREIGLRNASGIRELFPTIGVYTVGKYGMHVTYYDLSDEGYQRLLERANEQGDRDAHATADRVAALLKPYFTAAGYRRFVARLHSVAEAMTRRTAA